MLAVPPLKLAFMDSAYKENASTGGYLIHQRTIDTDSSTCFPFKPIQSSLYWNMH